MQYYVGDVIEDRRTGKQGRVVDTYFGNQSIKATMENGWYRDFYYDEVDLISRNDEDSVIDDILLALTDLEKERKIEALKECLKKLEVAE